QAEDGIRDFHVTGVQTCALPISEGSRRTYNQSPSGMEERVDIGAKSAVLGMFTQELTANGATGTRTAVCGGSHDWIAAALVIARSEERRVGKERRCRRSTAQDTK